MSRNLATSSCPHCGTTVKLSDIRGKPIEFRRYGPYVPVIGARWDCPCGVVYFVIWRPKDRFWGEATLPHAHEKVLPAALYGHRAPPAHLKNADAGRFYVDRPAIGEVLPARREETGCYTLDLSYYETYNDEPLPDGYDADAIRSGQTPPWHLCEDDAEEVCWEW